MKRRKSSFFDPDYRKEQWMHSKYAPKNNRATITETAAVLAILCSAPIFFIAYKVMDIRTIGLAFGVFFVLWIGFALWLRRREHNRLQKDLYNKEAPSLDINKTRQRVRNKELELSDLNHKDFEHECAWLLNTLSDYKAVVVGGAGDSGVDLELYQAGRLVGIAQCKYYDPKRPLSPNHIRELAGAREAIKVQTAQLFTTARFSDKTKQVAAEYGIELFDGKQLEAMREQAKAKAGYGKSAFIA